jgi:hypothetical protein
LQLTDEPQRLPPIVGLARDTQALRLEQAPEAGPEEIVVVDEQDAQLLELLPRAPILGG